MKEELKKLGLKSKLIFQKDSGGIYDKWPDGNLIKYIKSPDLNCKVECGEIEQVVSPGAAKILSDYKLCAYVCSLDNWLNGTMICGCNECMD
jgi:aspartokinase-like uncharacterized kinase